MTVDDGVRLLLAWVSIDIIANSKVSGKIPWLVLTSGPKEVISSLHAKMKGTLGAEMTVF